MKKVLPLLLVLVMCLSVFPAAPALAADIVSSGECGDNLTWTLDSEGTLTISGSGEMRDFYVDAAGGESGYYVYSDIPWTQKYTDVSYNYVGSSPYDINLNIKKVLLPEGLTGIGSFAFFGARISNIVIPSTVLRIGNDAFRECQNLTDIYYSGTEEQWRSVYIEDTDDPFMGAALRFNNNLFSDIPNGAYYEDAVAWAVNHEPQITNGIGEGLFGGDLTVTRGQAMTFLWRAMGEPKPTFTQDSAFTDVRSGDYFRDAVLWAVEQGITNGTDSTHFSPNKTCSCAEILTFLWRCMGEPDKTTGGAWYEDAVVWADKTGLLASTTFPIDPARDCPRRDVVYYLWVALAPHRYAFIIDDCTWTEAFANAKAAGGHLVVIENRAEYEEILREIASRGLTGVDFRIGARRAENGQDYYWVDENNSLTGSKINDTSYWTNAEFAEGEPSYTWGDFAEQYLSIYYDTAIGKWVWNDIPDQVYAPGRGRYGYVIEYESA